MIGWHNGNMRLPPQPSGRVRLAVAVGVVAFWLYFLVFTLHWWPTRLFILGFGATGGTALRMFYIRRQRGDGQALIPALIGLAGIIGQFILLGLSPQPLTLAGCVGLTAGAGAWAVYLLNRHRPQKQPHK